MRFPAFARVFAGFEPYQKLVDAARAAVIAPDAQVVPFAYDWRLPVAYNGRLLAERIDHASGRWRADPHHDAARRHHPTGRPAQAVIVAHSMGGLLIRYLSLIPGAADDIRATLTLGTPFYGSVKVAILLNTPVAGPRCRPSGR